MLRAPFGAKVRMIQINIREGIMTKRITNDDWQNFSWWYETSHGAQDTRASTASKAVSQLTNNS
jgi:hypothetical protein